MFLIPYYVQTQTYVKVYNLTKQELTKKLHSGVKWISSIDIHPQGEHCFNVWKILPLCWLMYHAHFFRRQFDNREL